LTRRDASLEAIARQAAGGPVSPGHERDARMAQDAAGLSEQVCRSRLREQLQGERGLGRARPAVMDGDRQLSGA